MNLVFFASFHPSQEKKKTGRPEMSDYSAQHTTQQGLPMYEATKELGFQLPLRKTVKPLKIRTTEKEMN
jgi:hypothetical protein